MKIYPEELRAAQIYWEAQTDTFPTLDKEQIRLLRQRAKSWHNAFRRHATAHNLLNILLLAGMFAVDYFVLWSWPDALGVGDRPLLKIGAVGLAAGIVHGFLMYSFIIFTIHEGATHNAIIQNAGPISRRLQPLCNNISRLFFADPEYYQKHHTHHHAFTNSERDGSFLVMLRPRRFLLALMPLAAVLPYNDLRVHLGQERTPSHLRSLAVGVVYTLFLVLTTTAAQGFFYMAMVLVVVAPWVGFFLDRMREGTEHALMPLDDLYGSRNFGAGLWGFVIGGGFWGQACHLSHHIAPGLPWYLQIRLHWYMHRVLRPEQKRVYFLTPLVGFPHLCARVLRTTRHYMAMALQAQEKPESRVAA
jgi:fatty acid desaturase